MKRFFIVLLLLAFASQIFATNLKTTLKKRNLIVLKTDTLMSVDIPNLMEFRFKNIFYQNDTLFIKGVEKITFYEIKDGPGIIPLARDKQIIFKGAYPRNGQPVTTEKSVLMPWKPVSSIYWFWLIFIGINMLFGIFLEKNKKKFLFVQLVTYAVLLLEIIYFQQRGFFSYSWFIVFNVFTLLGIVFGWLYHEFFDKEFKLAHVIGGFNFSVWIFLFLFSFIHKQAFSLPPKTFYITVSIVIVGYLLLPAILFIRKATRSERGESEKSKK